MQVLRGLVWDHTRGWAPMAVTGQVFADHHPGVRVEWDRQSLWDFGEGRTEQLAASYDLIVVDHPMAAVMAGSGLFRAFAAQDVAPAVGGSGASYVWDGLQWALPVDAACQVAAWRADLLSAAGEDVPVTWADVLALAARTGRVVMPLTPIDVLSSLLTLTAEHGAPVASTAGGFLDRDAARAAFALLRRLRDAVPDECARRNPIATLELLSRTDEALFCPLTFGYSNYARDGYAPARLAFGEVPRLAADRLATGSLLGGAGIAVTGTAPDIAIDYARWVASADVQRGEYVRAGGQPAAAAAWTDPAADAICHGFFSSTWATIDAASVRPKHPSYPRFQTQAADVVYRALHGAGRADDALDTVERLYEKHRCLDEPIGASS